MSYVTRYDMASNTWITGYYIGARFYVVAKATV